MKIEGMTANQMVKVLLKFKITANQFMLLFFLELDRIQQSTQTPGEDPAIALVYQYATSVQMWSFEEIDDLVEKGLLIDQNPKGHKRGAHPDHYIVTELFVDSIMSTWTDFDEFWNLYPSFCDNFDDFRGPKITLKGADYDETHTQYRKTVRTAAKHLRIMEIVKWAKDHGHIKMNIGKFVASRQWDVLEELRATSSSISSRTQTFL